MTPEALAASRPAFEADLALDWEAMRKADAERIYDAFMLLLESDHAKAEGVLEHLIDAAQEAKEERDAAREEAA